MFSIFSFIANVAYMLFVGILAVITGSAWYLAITAYYLVLSLLKGIVLYSKKKHGDSIFAQAQNFIQKYFNVSDIAYVERERDGLHNEFKVYLKNATEIDFDYHGNLESIDCQISPVPEGIVPQLIVDFVRLHHPDNFIVEYSIDHRSLEVELSNGFTLVFDMEGNFIRIDD